MSAFSLAELLIVACAEAWRNDGEVMATGIGPLPRLGASLARVTFNPAAMLTDGEGLYTTIPVAPGLRADPANVEGWAPYERTFSTLWGGKRHAMVGPVQMDRFGQTNLSVIGGTYKNPKAVFLGARGFPGNSIHHPNSFFFPIHSKRAFVAGEVDFVCMAGYNRKRWLGERKPQGLDLRLIVTNLAVMDFGGPDHAIRVKSLHPGVSFDEVQDNTDFDLARLDVLPQTPAPTPEQLAWIAKLDAKSVRHTVLKDNPPGDRRPA